MTPLSRSCDGCRSRSGHSVSLRHRPGVTPPWSFAREERSCEIGLLLLAARSSNLRLKALDVSEELVEGSLEPALLRVRAVGEVVVIGHGAAATCAARVG